MDSLLNSLYVFFIRNDIWIYILSGLVLLWYLVEFFRAKGRGRRAMFGLEREAALRARNAALLFILLLGGLIITVAYVNVVIRPTLPPSLLTLPTPTPDPSALPILEGEQTVTQPTSIPAAPLTVAPTVTLPGGAGPVTTVTAVPVPEGSVTRPPFLEPTPLIAGCTPRASITEPRPNERTVGPVNVSGTADTEDFAYYELEISGPQTNGRWANLLGRRIEQPVNLGFLGGNISLSRWEPGTYLIRLKVVNQEDDVTHQCVVSIELVQ